MMYDMQDMLAFSKGEALNTDTETLKAMLPGCISVEISTESTDRNGIDYIATLRKGARIFIDAKTRSQGCSRFWKVDANGLKHPEIALELWSVKPNGKYKRTEGKVGWTLCEKKQTDMILYTFDETDCRDVFLFSFQLLRMVFRRNCKEWMETFKVDVQDSGKWESQAVFIPVSVVFDAIRLASQATSSRSGECLKLEYNCNF